MMPMAVIMCIGVLGLVLDVGIFRLIDREFENAAAAAALAAAWYDPVCPVPTNPQFLGPDTRCTTNKSDGTPRPDNTYQPQPNDTATQVAVDIANRNLGLAKKLCSDVPTIQVNTGSIQNPSANAVSVIISCHAPFLAGAILRAGDGGTLTRWATAAIGSVQTNGTFAFVPTQDKELLATLVSL